MKLYFNVILNITYIIENIVEMILYVSLRLGLTIGLFFVSAGLFLNINKHPVIPIITLLIKFNCMFKQTIGSPINIITDDIRHIQLFVACIPNDGILRTLYINKNITVSLNKPRIIDINAIIINLEIVKYIPVRPYSISASLTLS